MKKINLVFLTLLLVAFAFCSPANASERTYNLYLTTAVSGSTTVISGTSNMILEGEGISREQGLYTIHQGGKKVTAMVFQLYDAIAAPPGNSSNSNFSIGYKESIYDTTEHWAATGVTNLLSGVSLLSGSSRQQVVWTPTGIGSMRFHFISGITPFSAATGVLKLYYEN